MQNINKKKNNLFRKFIGVLLLFAIGGVSTIDGSNHSADDTQSLQRLIRQIKTAPVSQKRVLINRLKIQLRTMQQHKRDKIIHDLRRTFSTHQEHTPITQIHKNNHSKETTAQPMKHSIITTRQLKYIQESTRHDHDNKAPNHPKNMPSSYPNKQYTPNMPGRDTDTKPNRNLPDTNHQNDNHNGVGNGNGGMGGNPGENSGNGGMNGNMGGGNSGGRHGYGSHGDNNQGRGGR